MKRTVFLFVVIFTILITGCSSDSLNNSNDNTPDYQGDALVIGIAGNEPDIENENITYKNVTLEDFWKDDDLDGLIFNNQDLFQDLSQPKYVTIFKEMNIPTFFIGLDKPFYVFLQEDLIYNDTPENESFAKIQGFVFDKNDIRTTWEVKVKENDYNSPSTYTNIFNIINEYD